MKHEAILSHLVDQCLLSNDYPVFLLTIPDILELSPPIYYLFQSRYDCTFIVSTEEKMKDIWKFLRIFHKNYLKIAHKSKSYLTPYQFLHSAVNKIRQMIDGMIFIFSPILTNN
ncbi:hypothetical protein M0811_14318 [Anaeramoeba ignava]|uniref:Uncharacterized protein n=1 Tax=Anaeramoeba ignava TaxID=1746090 RepID=A0A9Q0LYV2_ANAIG|nr:hypothetical protein M0811_14318 [Anaeramoeba ignava]